MSSLDATSKSVFAGAQLSTSDIKIVGFETNDMKATSSVTKKDAKRQGVLIASSQI